MRKLLFTLGIMIIALNALCQDNSIITEGQSQLIYSLPMTELQFELEVEKTTRTPGPYFQYSERYLATNQVVVEEKTTYRLKDTRLKTKALPDPARTYFVPKSKYPVLQQIVLNEDGLLCGINFPYTPEVKSKGPKNPKAKKTESTQLVLPLTEEYLMAGSTAKLAEGAAKQIYRIRESRISLITGDVEHMPADGASMKKLLQEMDRMETELTELFIGKIRTETVRHTIKLTPKEAVNKMILFRVSALKGLVDVTDLSGVPFFMSVSPKKTNAQPADPKAKKVNVAVNTILAARTTISLSDGINTILSQDILMPQFGLVVPLTEDMFAQPTTSLKVDPHTGRILQIGK